MDPPPFTIDIRSSERSPDTSIDAMDSNDERNQDFLFYEGNRSEDEDHDQENVATSRIVSQGHNHAEDEGDVCKTQSEITEPIRCETEFLLPSVVAVMDSANAGHEIEHNDYHTSGNDRTDASITSSDLDLISESDLIVRLRQFAGPTGQTLPVPWTAPVSSRTDEGDEDDDEADVQSDVAVEPDDTDEDHDRSWDDEDMDASGSSSLSRGNRGHHAGGGSDQAIEGCRHDNDSSSSSSFTHDEWWDWLDNLTVAFIEINDDSLSDDPNDNHGTSTTNKSKTGLYAPYPNLYQHPKGMHNTSTELTVPNTSYDGTTERETEEPSSSWDVTMESMIEEEESVVIVQGTSQVKGTWDLTDPRFPADLASIAPSDELFIDDDSYHRRLPHEFQIRRSQQLSITRAPPSWHAAGWLRPSASIADFRSVTEQPQSIHQQSLSNSRMLRISRSVSFKDLVLATTHDSRRPSDVENEPQRLQLRRITSNENLLLTLNQHRKNGLRPSSLVQQQRPRDALEGMMVCFAPASTKPPRSRLNRFIAVVAAAVVIVAVLSRSSLTMLSTSENDVMTMEEMMCPKPRVVHLDWEHASSMAKREAQYVWDHSIEVMSDAYRQVTQRIPTTQHHPRVVRIDCETYKSIVHRDASAMLNASKNFMADAYQTMNGKINITQVQVGLESLRKSVWELHDAVLAKVTNLCNNQISKGPSVGWTDACSCLLQVLPERSSLLEQLHLSEAIDLVTNETSALIRVLHGMWQYQLYGIVVKEDQECFREDLPYAVKALSNFTPIVARPSTVLSDNYRSNSVTKGRTLDKANDAPEAPRVSLLFSNFTAFASLPRRFGSSREDSKAAKSASPSKKEVRKHVQDIVSRLEAHGRLPELEKLLVARFGDDDKDPAGRPPKVPLLGKDREEHLKELWLRNMEREIVIATFGNRLDGKDVLWRSFKRRFESLVGSVSKNVWRWNLAQVIEEIRSMTLNGTTLNDFWLLDIGQVLRNNKNGERHATGVARFEWLNELWTINDADVVRDLTRSKSL